MKNDNQNTIIPRQLVGAALKQAFIKLDPRIMFRNPVMFTVELGTAIMIAVCCWIAAGEASRAVFMYNIVVTAILLITLLFANFAEAIAEARGKAQADESPQNKGRYTGQKDRSGGRDLHQ